MTDKLEISIATWDYDRVRPIVDGRVAVEGCHIEYDILNPERTFEHTYTDKKYDVVEMGLLPYFSALSRDTANYRAIPVFISRMFRHSAIYIRKNSGIINPVDLIGRRIGTTYYQSSAAAWVRGFLLDQYGIAADALHWFRDGTHMLAANKMFALNLPERFPLENLPEGADISDMLVAGDLDAIIDPHPPKAFLNGHYNICRLFEDFKFVEKKYFQETGIFPIMHALGIRHEIAEAHPWLAGSLYKAYSDALKIALQDLNEVLALKISLPWVGQELAETKIAFGRDDYWQYGIPNNQITLDVLMRYAEEQGLIARPLSLEEAFLPIKLS